MTNPISDDFKELASSRSTANVFSDFWHLVRKTRKWWLVPVLLLLLMIGGLLILGGTPLAPFIYTLF